MEDLECKVCLEKYDTRERLPRYLTCGHSMCTLCVCQLLQRGPLICPFCRARPRTSVASSVDVPVNYSILKVMHRGSLMPYNTPKEWLSFLKQDLAKNTYSLFLEFDEDLIELRKFQKCLQSTEESHARLLSNIPRYVECLKEIGRELNELSMVTRKAVEKGNLTWNMLTKYQNNLAKSRTMSRMFSAHKVIIAYQSSLRKWKTEVQELQKSNVLRKAKEVNLDAIHKIAAAREQIPVEAGTGEKCFVLLVVTLSWFLMIKCYKYL